MEIRISPTELEKLIRDAGMVSPDWSIQGISRCTGLIPTIKVYLVKREKATADNTHKNS